MNANGMIHSAVLSIRMAQRRIDRRDVSRAIIDLQEARDSLDSASRELESTIAALECPDGDTGVHAIEPAFLRGNAPRE